MSEWKDIETAPLDTWILIYVPDREDCNFRIGIWSSKTNMNDYKPTHWMPLPPLPKKKHHCYGKDFECYSCPDQSLEVAFADKGELLLVNKVLYCPFCGESASGEKA